MLTEQPRLNTTGELELVVIEFYTREDRKYACATNRGLPPSPLLRAVDYGAKLKWRFQDYGKPTLELGKGTQPTLYGVMTQVPAQEHPGVASGQLISETAALPVLDIHAISHNSLASWYGCIWAPDGIVNEHFEQ